MLFGFCLTDLLNPTSGRDTSHICLISFEPKTHVYHYYTCVLGSKLIRHTWKASLPDVGLSKSVRQKPKSMSQSGQYLLIGG